MAEMVRKRIRDMSPCRDAVKWLGRRRDPFEAYENCPQGEWIVWLHKHVGFPRITEEIARADLQATSQAAELYPESRTRVTPALEAAMDSMAKKSIGDMGRCECRRSELPVSGRCRLVYNAAYDACTAAPHLK